jgi:hypothetical protein
MEIRRDSPRGPTLGYAPYQSLNNTIYLVNYNYNLFPVFKKYDANRDLITTIYPKRNDQTNSPMRTGKSLEGNAEVEMNADTFSKGITNFTTGYAYLVVDNKSSDGVQVMKGDVVQQTATGMKMVNPGAQRTFLVEMPAVTNDDSTIFEIKTVFAGWTIGETSDPKHIPVSETLKDVEISADENVFEADFMYTVTVTGNANTTGLNVSAPIKGAKVSL